MGKEQEQTVLRLWFDWCKLWPVYYGRDSLAVKDEGYDPIFDVIPSQAYKDFYFEVIRGHPTLKGLNPFEVIDTALNQIPAPEVPIVVAEPVVSDDDLEALSCEDDEPEEFNLSAKVVSTVIPHAPAKSGRHRVARNGGSAAPDVEPDDDS